MKFKKTIHVPQKFVFDKVIESVLYDIQQQTGRKLNSRVLNGLEYTKKIQGPNAANIKIDEVTSPSLYAFTTETSEGRYSTRWQFKTLAEDETEVFISEKATAKSTLQIFNNFIVWAFMEAAKKRALRTMLDKMEQTYHEN